MGDTYFDTQSAALTRVQEKVFRAGYEIRYPDNIWSEHVNYGTTVKYDFPLTLIRTGNEAKKWVHIQLYRMDSGKYELNFYIG